MQTQIARSWGGPQQLSGPFLIVPYSVRVVTMEGDKRVEQTVESVPCSPPKPRTSRPTRHRKCYIAAFTKRRRKIHISFDPPDQRGRGRFSL